MSPMKSSGMSTAMSEMVSDDDGEADLPRALQARPQRLFALFDVADDVLDHDDRVVDHEAGRDGQRHEREVVEAVAAQVHRGEGADEREGHRDARDEGRREGAQEEEDDARRPGRRSASARIPRRRPRRGWWWCGRSGWRLRPTAGSDGAACGSSLLMRSTTAMMFAPGWRWMLTMTAGCVHPRGLRMFSMSSIDRGHVGEPHRRAVA